MYALLQLHVLCTFSGRCVTRPATTAPVRAYAMRAREDPDIPGVIAGTFTLFDIDLYALIDLGFTHSYIYAWNK